MPLRRLDAGRARLAGLDFLNVSSRRFTRPEWPERDPALGIAGWTKKLSGLPVISTGSVGLDSDMFADLFDGKDPALSIAADLAELVRRFRAGEFDLVGIGRMQIANPDFVRNLAEGRIGALRLYNKQVDLGHLFAQIEPGMMEESRKLADV